MSERRECPQCRGTGEHCHIGECTDPCDVCRGRKYIIIPDLMAPDTIAISAEPAPPERLHADAALGREPGTTAAMERFAARRKPGEPCEWCGVASSYDDPHTRDKCFARVKLMLRETQDGLAKSRNVNAQLSLDVHAADEARQKLARKYQQLKREKPMEHMREIKRAQEKMRHWQGNHRNMVAENDRLRRILKDVAGMSAADIAAGKVAELLQQATGEPLLVPRYPVGGEGTDWRKRHADASAAAVETKLVQDVIRELCQNLGVRFGHGLPWYGITKVAHYTANVARAQALGMDPEDLRV